VECWWVVAYTAACAYVSFPKFAATTPILMALDVSIVDFRAGKPSTLPATSENAPSTHFVNKARRNAELRVPQPYSTQTAQRPRINTVPSDKAPHFVCPSARRIPYSPTNVQPHQPSVKTTAETWPAQRLSRKSAIFSPSIRQGDYRILPQETSCSISGLNTVLSDKSIPYPPARNYRTLRQISAAYGPSYDPHESIGQELPANQAFC
jgi:hypothetical protein